MVTVNLHCPRCQPVQVYRPIELYLAEPRFLASG
ncbi:TPA: hypothetical protein K8270_004860, partial [Escherichia coli]|nr:hypothetical protein [Escherichia coli]EFJ3551889.1 hypothetical protein [Escherichia coli]EGM1007266.1 hypothetical protein [Escherichia coli]HBI8079396.1 hypothetical protein [Escherichia coli]HBQ4703759.1 hypothetical protein [Escherichia coli]